MNDDQIKAVHTVVKALCKKRGYADIPSEADVELVFEAILLIGREMRKDKKNHRRLDG